MAWVQDFEVGDKDQRDLLGGKGANIAEMTRLGLPVPPGFTITTDACRAYLRDGVVPADLMAQVFSHLDGLELKTGKRLGDSKDPLLVSVRSGAKFSMPGMMDTVLNLGLNDDSFGGLATQTGDRRFALDSYRRFIQMFGKIVRGIEGEAFDSVWVDEKARAGAADDADLDETALALIVEGFKDVFESGTGEPFPANPREQLRQAITAVFTSWTGRRARDYRRINKIPDDLGTACNIQTMVFGNKGADSGTGVAFTRDPNTGAPVPVIDFLQNAQGEDVVSGVRKTQDAAGFRSTFPMQADELAKVMRLLEQHFREVCDLEFTIEQTHLFLLQTRVAKRTAQSALRIAVDLVQERLISREEAVTRVTPQQLDQLLHPRFDSSKRIDVIAKGVAASPGAATGTALFDADIAEERANAGEAVILVREVTSPDDLHGMAVSKGILTAQGGNLSHAAIVAKGMGIPAVCGAEISIDMDSRSFRAGGVTVSEGDLISIDGTDGVVVEGSVQVIVPEPDETFHTLLGWADELRQLGIRANADLPEDCRRARAYGAEGVGLTRTEHMFLGDRLPLLQRYILSGDPAESQAALDALEAQQRADFVGIFEAMDGLPVTIRLLDPPLHEFLPDFDSLIVKEAAGTITPDEQETLRKIRPMQEENPMLGFRGCRLGIIHPELSRMQCRAIASAVVDRLRVGGDPRPEIMVPLVAHRRELEVLREIAVEEWTNVLAEAGFERDVQVGTMIEVPRAAIRAGVIAEVADFFSFGTNDLTQTTWAFSRDDAEATFLGRYLEMKILTSNPFESIDVDGVGFLVEMATRAGRQTKPDLKVGVCGEHGGDPESIRFFHGIGLDYVSMSPFRVPIARLAAAQAAIEHAGPRDV